jgi:hypothetical protein
VPLGQLFPFARTDVFPTGVQARIDLTISDTHCQDMFFSEILRGQAGSASVSLRHQGVKQADGSASTEPTSNVKTIGDGTNNDGANFTQDVDVAAYLRPVPAATRAPIIEVDEIFLDCMMAIPSAPLPPPKSLQIAY